MRTPLLHLCANKEKWQSILEISSFVVKSQTDWRRKRMGWNSGATHCRKTCSVNALNCTEPVAPYLRDNWSSWPAVWLLACTSRAWLAFPCPSPHTVTLVTLVSAVLPPLQVQCHWAGGSPRIWLYFDFLSYLARGSRNRGGFINWYLGNSSQMEVLELWYIYGLWAGISNSTVFHTEVWRSHECGSFHPAFVDDSFNPLRLLEMSGHKVCVADEMKSRSTPELIHESLCCWQEIL